MSAVNRHFLRHYAEMVAAMMLGMVVLGVPLEPALQMAGSGWSELHDDMPGAALSLMAVTMTVPMVGWMRFRGHGWAPCTEMAAAMIVPSLGVLGLLAADAVSDIGALMAIEHVAMFAAMFGAMLLRPAEYSHHQVTA
jgi:hypothetical protein